MENSYNFEKNENYIIYRLDDTVEYEPQTLKNILKDGIYGALKIKPIKDENGKMFMFNTNGLVPLKEYLEEPNAAKVLKFFQQFSHTLRDMDNRDISLKYIALNKECVFVNPETHKVFITVVPVKDFNAYINVRLFLKQILTNLEYDEEENLDYVGKLIAALNDKNFMIERFETKILNILHSYGIDKFEEVVTEDDLFTFVGDVKTVCPDSGNSSDRNYETHKIDVEEKENDKEYPYLLRKMTGEKIYLSKERMLIGKDREDVDYRLVGNDAFSRKHAWIIDRDGEYYIIDNHSSNGTYINKMKINPSIEYYISEGTTIHLANEEFIFVKQ